jgi:phosphate transport system permease protein
LRDVRTLDARSPVAEPRTKRTRRTRRTRKTVRIAEVAARTLISIGGIVTILAVGLICVFLVWVVVPLFRGAEISAKTTLKTSSSARHAEPLHTAIDEYRRLAWTVYGDGELDVTRLDNGERISTHALFDGFAPTCAAFDIDEASVAFGFANGDVRVGGVDFSSRFIAEDAATDAARALKAGEVAAFEDGIVERTSEGQLRVQALTIAIGAPVRASPSGARIELIDISTLPDGPVLCVLAADGALTIDSVRKTQNLLTGEETTTLASGVLPYQPRNAEKPAFLRLFGGGDNVVLAWRDGTCTRFDVRDFDKPREAESVDLVPPAGAELSSLEFLTGKRTLVAGDSAGGLRGWFRTKPAGAATCDGATLVCGHEIAARGAAVTAIAPSRASHTFAAGYANGDVALFYMTNETPLGTARVNSVTPIERLALAPRQDGALAITAQGSQCFDVDARHPEASLASLFRPVWYENYPAPANVWQSSSGNDLEPKFGLLPLIFGTLKATFYSMLFGAPLALLAAIFSSEFLHPRLRVGLKSLIEVMASLPSVVLGFLAAMVIAPFVQSSLAVVLTAFFVLPTTLVLGAHLWQLLPHKLTLRLEGWQRFAVICATLPLGLALAIVLAPGVESVLFAGDIEHWLDRQRGGPIGGWMLLLVPLCAAITALAFNRFVSPWVRRISLSWSRRRCARIDLLRFLAFAATTLALAFCASALLGALHFDPRGPLVDTYVQRNALVVGVLMGFAIIPLIYTLAEDALTSVPQHLRLASLGAGATQWQTAVRVIIPTAASGLFSAMMIGLGRAVGETMIVLMAAGNTPVMDWNVFSGFRTLSANIATELPEAVQNSTHYRTLFLAALALFAMTLLVNTAAELVRQRFRKRAYQL